MYNFGYKKLTLYQTIPLLLSGELTLSGRLDYETATDNQLTVTAYNKEGAPANHMTSASMVYVTVIDENDHPPHIRVATAGNDSIARVSINSTIDCL